MTTYAPDGFTEHSVIGPHEGVRVTFAQTRSMFTPDFVERADFENNIEHLIDQMEGGGFALAPASDVTVAPGELAATIDFAVTTPGTISVARALAQLQDGLYGALDLARRTYIRNVAYLGSRTWGTAIPDEHADTERGFFDWVPWAIGAGVVAAVLWFSPEIKGALRAARRS